MKWYYITFRSVTAAQMGERILRRNRIECTLQRTPRWMEQKGCGYCLKLRQGDLEPALQALREGGASYSKVYLRQDGAEAGEVEL